MTKFTYVNLHAEKIGPNLHAEKKWSNSYSVAGPLMSFIYCTESNNNSHT